MKMRVVMLGSFLVAGAASWAPVSTARADLDDLGATLFRGINYVGNPLFLSNPQNGPFFNENLYTQRIERNRAGGGYTYENYRFFGQDSYGNPNTLDLGPLKVLLSRNATLTNSVQPVGLHTRLGYTTTLIPEVFVQQRTVQRSVDVLSGTSEVTVAPINYNITVNTGIQDFTVDGNIFMDTRGRINALGFYDLRMRVTNNGTYNADGVLITDEQNLDFDVGPINVSGNIVADVAAGVLQQVGRTLDAVPPRVASGAAQKDKTLEDVLAKVNAGETLTPDEVTVLVRESLVNAVLTDPVGTLVNGLPGGTTGIEGVSVQFSPADPSATVRLAPGGEATGNVVPEPGTLLLMLTAVSLACLRIERRRAFSI